MHPRTPLSFPASRHRRQKEPGHRQSFGGALRRQNDPRGTGRRGGRFSMPADRSSGAPALSAARPAGRAAHW